MNRSINVSKTSKYANKTPLSPPLCNLKEFKVLQKSEKELLENQHLNKLSQKIFNNRTRYRP